VHSWFKEHHEFCGTGEILRDNIGRVKPALELIDDNELAKKKTPVRERAMGTTRWLRIEA
jgi:hypothetical protein